MCSNATCKSNIEIINGVPTRILSIEREVRSELSDVKILVLLISGNPGVIEFYRTYVEALSYEFRKEFGNLDPIPIWSIGQAGHDVNLSDEPFPSLKEHKDVYNLEGQIQHKEIFIKDYVPKHVKLVLIGHSIGSWIILELLKRNPVLTERVLKACCLFPTVQRMRDSPQGIFFRRLPSWLLPNFVWPFDFLFSTWMKKKLAQLYLALLNPSAPDCVVTGIITLVNSSVLEKVIFMANEEMEKVYDLDVSTIKANKDRLHFYFGVKDEWCPLSYVQIMQDELGEHFQYEIDQNGYAHAFVLDSSEGMASTTFSIICPTIKQYFHI